MATDPRAAADSVIAGGLVASVAWASWLSELNQVLTTLTLLVGLALGVGRLWQFLKKRGSQ
jgi:hypothetical protein